MQGYIKDHRKELVSDIWQMPPLYHRVWQWLKYQVNHEGREIPQPDGTRFLINRGQHLTSIRNIAQGVGWYEGALWKQPNPKTIDTILKWMVKNDMISVDRGRGNRQYTLITLLNWDIYNPKDNDGVTANGEAREQQTDINNNVKNVKKKDIKRYSSFSSKKNTRTKKKESGESEGKPVPPKDHTAIIEQVIQYLNAKLDTKYRPTTKTIKEMVNGRLNEGYTLDDFKYVIDVKAAEWLGDPKMEKYLRPSTLFRPTNFPEYLNQKMPVAVEGGSGLSKENERLLKKIQEEKANEEIGVSSDYCDHPKQLQ
ncbi:conserved phage C-terminal domain-containing protein [Paenibacillus sp. Pae108]|uniref:conserved phage C-terminal domain-containing protein n=1 Tax=Paenibacillus sp. Pae108 TaxID=2926019 RepID=UPI002119A4C5|nr:conserved phage C-terminal domain-containing protein [Paenibacillus sp. Pae108]